MLKDKVIKPLLVATERVVEYYFPEEKKNDEIMKNAVRALDGKQCENNSVLERSGKK
jgi:hypothetical protein